MVWRYRYNLAPILSAGNGSAVGTSVFIAKVGLSFQGMETASIGRICGDIDVDSWSHGSVADKITSSNEYLGEYEKLNLSILPGPIKRGTMQTNACTTHTRFLMAFR